MIQYYIDTKGAVTFTDAATGSNGEVGGGVAGNEYQAWLTAGNTPLPAPIAAPVPNVDGFIASVKTTFGGVAGILALPQAEQNAITLCLSAIDKGQWADAQTIIISMPPALGAAYAAIKAAAAANNISQLTLP